jgi:hypothetical protein
VRGDLQRGPAAPRADCPQRNWQSCLATNSRPKAIWRRRC